MKNILIFSAHPDDEILGMGGTMQKYKEKKYTVTVCLVTDGSSAQYMNKPELWEKKDWEHKKALVMLGVDKLIRLNFPDMRLDVVPHVELNRKMNEVFEKVRPEIVFTHSENDINWDHKKVYYSTTVIARPLNSFLRRVYSYEVLSSSEWSLGEPFQPNYFVDIGKYLKKEKEAFSVMETEVCAYPHPRSLAGIEILASYRGLQNGCVYAEAFNLIKANE